MLGVGIRDPVPTLFRCSAAYAILRAVIKDPVPTLFRFSAACTILCAPSEPLPVFTTHAMLDAELMDPVPTLFRFSAAYATFCFEHRGHSPHNPQNRGETRIGADCSKRAQEPDDNIESNLKYGVPEQSCSQGVASLCKVRTLSHFSCASTVCCSASSCGELPRKSWNVATS